MILQVDFVDSVGAAFSESLLIDIIANTKSKDIRWELNLSSDTSLEFD